MKTKKGNIFCNSCMYCNFNDYSNKHICAFNGVAKQSFLTKYVVYPNCEEKNKNNDCKDYRSYWQVFWSYLPRFMRIYEKGKCTLTKQK